MSMYKLIEEVKECIEREYGRAGAHFGLTHHSDHEAYAVLLEEYSEAKFEATMFHTHLEEFWNYVMRDDDPDIKLVCCQDMEKKALLCACEMIQVAAMAKKAALTVCDRAAQNEILADGGKN